MVVACLMFQETVKLPFTVAVPCYVCCVLCWVVSDPGDWIHQAPLSTGFSRREYWSVLPFPFLGAVGGGIFPTQELNLDLLLWGRFFTNWATRDLVSLHFFTLYFFKYTFNVRIDSDRQKSCKESTERSRYPHPRFLAVNISGLWGALFTAEETTLTHGFKLHSSFVFRSSLPLVSSFCWRTPSREPHHLSLSRLLSLSWSLTVSQTFSVFDDLNSFEACWPSIL